MALVQRAGARAGVSWERGRPRPLAWAEWLVRGLAEDEAEALRQATRTGRPCGGTAFVRELEGKLARPLAPQKRDPKPRPAQAEQIPGLFDE